MMAYYWDIDGYLQFAVDCSKTKGEYWFETYG